MGSPVLQCQIAQKIFNDTPLGGSSLDFDPTYQVKTSWNKPN